MNPLMVKMAMKMGKGSKLNFRKTNRSSAQGGGASFGNKGSTRIIYNYATPQSQPPPASGVNWEYVGIGAVCFVAYVFAKKNKWI